MIVFQMGTAPACAVSHTGTVTSLSPLPSLPEPCWFFQIFFGEVESEAYAVSKPQARGGFAQRHNVVLFLLCFPFLIIAVV